MEDTAPASCPAFEHLGKTESLFIIVGVRDRNERMDLESSEAVESGPLLLAGEVFQKS